MVNVLGLMWDTLQDTLRLAGKSYPTLQSTKPTKREVLQDLSKTFDQPLFDHGLLQFELRTMQCSFSNTDSIALSIGDKSSLIMKGAST